MILIARDKAPAKLAKIQVKQLAVLREIIRTQGRDPTSKEITGYRIPDVTAVLHGMQHGKCCFCERHIMEANYDVEHYRPKAEAKRQNKNNDGCRETHGYWWLAFNWDNLLYACKNCNESYKRALFPLANGSTPLYAEQMPPGNEQPLLINPCGTINPVEHIEFYCSNAIPSHERWLAKPRHDSLLGSETIRVLGLNEKPNIDKHTSIVQTRILHQVASFEKYWHQPEFITTLFNSAHRLFAPENDYAALQYDALRHYIPNARLQACIGQSWPEPAAVGKIQR